MTDGFGKRLGERLRVENAPAIIARAFRTADVEVTEIRYDNSLSAMRHPSQQEDSFIVAFRLGNVPNRQYWEDDRRTPMCDLRAGQTCLYDLKRNAAALLDRPFPSLSYPRAIYCGARNHQNGCWALKRGAGRYMRRSPAT